MTRHPFVWLASQSPRRRQLLDQVGCAHRLLVAGPHEDAEALETERRGELPLAYVQRVTRAKLDAALHRPLRAQADRAPVLAADTTVALGRSILGKPASADAARATLQRLSGRVHRVLTAVAVARVAPRGRIERRIAVNVTRVWFAPLTSAFVDAYVASGESSGKAGAYAIQGPMAAWIARIDGSYSGVMGLPLHETVDLLRWAGVDLDARASADHSLA